MKEVYVIFKYVEDEFPTPEVFMSKESYEKRFDELKEELLQNEDGEAYVDDEIDGQVASLLCEDTIYRACMFEINGDVEPRELYLYCDVENDTYFQMGHVGLDTDFNEVLGMYQSYVKELRETIDEHLAHANEYDTQYSEDYNGEESRGTITMYTEGGRYGGCFLGANMCKVTADNFIN